MGEEIHSIQDEILADWLKKLQISNEGSLFCGCKLPAWKKVGEKREKNHLSTGRKEEGR